MFAPIWTNPIPGARLQPPGVWVLWGETYLDYDLAHGVDHNIDQGADHGIEKVREVDPDDSDNISLDSLHIRVLERCVTKYQPPDRLFLVIILFCFLFVLLAKIKYQMPATWQVAQCSFSFWNKNLLFKDFVLNCGWVGVKSSQHFSLV